MRALVTVFYKNTHPEGMGIPPVAKIMEGADESNFVRAVHLFLMGCQLEGRTISSHTITLLPNA